MPIPEEIHFEIQTFLPRCNCWNGLQTQPSPFCPDAVDGIMFELRTELTYPARRSAAARVGEGWPPDRIPGGAFLL